MTTAPKATEPLAEENAFVRFVKALFEFSFKEFVTPKLISILYGITLVLIGLFVLIAIFNALDNDFADGSDKLVSVLVALGFGFLAVLYARVWMELIVVLFKIAEPVTDAARTLHRIEQLMAAGAVVTGAGPAGQPSAQSTCPNCRAQVGADQKFCRSCGHETIGASGGSSEGGAPSGRSEEPPVSPTDSFLADAAESSSDESEDAAEPSELAPVDCPNCGMENTPGSRFCFRCGRELD